MPLRALPKALPKRQPVKRQMALCVVSGKKERHRPRAPASLMNHNYNCRSGRCTTTRLSLDPVNCIRHRRGGLLVTLAAVSTSTARLASLAATGKCLSMKNDTSPPRVQQASALLVRAAPSLPFASAAKNRHVQMSKSSESDKERRDE